jgi:uncharacterized membrane protein
MAAQKKWTDQGIEIIVGNLLRAGVLLAAFVVLVGAVIYLMRHGHAPVDYRIFRGEPADLRGVRGITRNSLGFHGRAIIQFGLLLLIATPVARVAFCIFAFAKERDRTYVVFTTVVFSILLYSLLGSI